MGLQRSAPDERRSACVWEYYLVNAGHLFMLLALQAPKGEVADRQEGRWASSAARHSSDGLLILAAVHLADQPLAASGLLAD